MNDASLLASAAYPNRAQVANLIKFAGLIRSCAFAAYDDSGWIVSVVAPRAFLVSEVPESLEVGGGPCRPEKSGELAVIYIDGFDTIPHRDEIVRLLTRELEPFIIGVGEISLHETPKGLVVRLCDEGRKDCRHGAAYVDELSATRGPHSIVGLPS